MRPLAITLILFYAVMLHGAGFRDGPVAVAEFYQPAGIVVAPDGVVYVADRGNHTIRVIRGGQVATLAGLAGEPELRDGRGGVARFRMPQGLFLDRAGNVWVADWGNHAVRRISPDGVVQTIAGPASSHPLHVLELQHPSGVAVAHDGTVYIADTHGGTIRRISPDGTVENYPEPDPSRRSRDEFRPSAIAFDSKGRLLVGDDASEGLFRVVFGKRMELLAGGEGGETKVGRPRGIALMRNGSILVAAEEGFMKRSGDNSYGGWGDAMIEIRRNGKAARFGRTAAAGVAIDAAGRILATTYNNDAIVAVEGNVDRGRELPLAGKRSEHPLRHRYAANPPRPLPENHHRAVKGKPFAFPREGRWRLVRVPADSSASVSEDGFTPDSGDVFDFENVSDGGLLRVEVLDVVRDRAAVRAALLRMAPLPMSAAEERAVLGLAVKDPPDPEGDPARLAAYWGWAFGAPGPVKKALLAAAESGRLSDDDFMRVIDGLPPTPKVLERMRGYAAGRLSDKNYLQRVNRWLVENDPGRRGELVGELRSLGATGALHGDYRVRQLARKDWKAVEGLLAGWSVHQSPRLRALANALIYRHAMEKGDEVRASKARAVLIPIVEDREAPGLARMEALRALTMGDDEQYYFAEPRGWPARDQWLLSLFADGTLREMVDDSTLVRPLEHVILGAPDRLVPLAAPLLRNHNDPAVRGTAVHVLAGLLEVDDLPVFAGQLSKPLVEEQLQRRIASELVAWIGEPESQSERGRVRNLIIDAAARFEIRAAAPHIRRALQDPHTRDAAAGALARLTGVAGDGLRVEVERRSNESERLWLYDRVWATRPLPPEEIAAAIEAFVRNEQRPGAQTFSYAAKLPVEASIGAYAAKHLGEDDRVTPALIARIERLGPDDRAVADALFDVLHTSTRHDARVLMFRRIAGGEADASLIAAVLEQRTAFVESLDADVRRMAAEAGPGQAVAVAMLRDDRAAMEILARPDPEGVELLLGSAMLTRWELPLQSLRQRLERYPREARMIDSYLASIDTNATRELLWSRHRRVVTISGDARGTSGSCGGSAFEKEEHALREELASGRVRAVRALFRQSAGPCASMLPSIVIRQFPDGHGTVSVGLMAADDPPRLRITRLEPESVDQLFERLDSFGLDALPRLLPAAALAHDAGVAEYFEAEGVRGRRLVFRYAPIIDATGYGKAHRLFTELEATPPRGINAVVGATTGSHYSRLFVVLSVVFGAAFSLKRLRASSSPR